MPLIGELGGVMILPVTALKVSKNLVQTKMLNLPTNWKVVKIQYVEVRKEECEYYYEKQSIVGLLLSMKSLILQVYHYA